MNRLLSRRGLFPVDIFREVEEALRRDVGGVSRWDTMLDRRPAGMPPVEMVRFKDYDELRLSASGFKKEDLKVSVVPAEGLLEITAEKSTSSEEEGERLWGGFARSGFSWKRQDLSRNYDLEGVEARLEDGTLKLKLPHMKGEAFEVGKQIEIK